MVDQAQQATAHVPLQRYMALRANSRQQRGAGRVQPGMQDWEQDERQRPAAHRSRMEMAAARDRATTWHREQMG